MQTFNDILDSFLNSILDSLSNPYSLLIFILLSALSISLFISIFSQKTRAKLVRYKILEPHENPASFLLLIVSILLAIKLVQAYLVQPFLVDGSSMYPTLRSGELLIINKTSGGIEDLKRGDVIVFRHTFNDMFDGKFFIKRLIALPGDHIVVKDGVTTIDHTEEAINPKENSVIRVSGKDILDESFVKYTDTLKNADIQLGGDEYFVMGDNRLESYDSRSWGVLHKKDISGKAVYRILPFSDFGSQPGKVQFNFK